MFKCLRNVVRIVWRDDDGPVLAQARLRIRPQEAPEALEKRVLEEEHKLYPQALEDYCRAILLARRGEAVSGA